MGSANLGADIETDSMSDDMSGEERKHIDPKFDVPGSIQLGKTMVDFESPDESNLTLNNGLSAKSSIDHKLDNGGFGEVNTENVHLSKGELDMTGDISSEAVIAGSSNFVRVDVNGSPVGSKSNHQLKIHKDVTFDSHLSASTITPPKATVQMETSPNAQPTSPPKNHKKGTSIGLKIKDFFHHKSGKKSEKDVHSPTEVRTSPVQTGEQAGTTDPRIQFLQRGQISAATPDGLGFGTAVDLDFDDGNGKKMGHVSNDTSAVTIVNVSQDIRETTSDSVDSLQVSSNNSQEFSMHCR